MTPTRARADAIADALGELAGKRLDRPTAHSIGKLFQKRLVGRPAWIGDGQSVATLRKFTGHGDNTYRIDVSAPRQDDDAPTANTFSTAASTKEHSPLPLFPRRNNRVTASRGKGGMWGMWPPLSPATVRIRRTPTETFRVEVADMSAAEIAERSAIIEEGDDCDRNIGDRRALTEAGYGSWQAYVNAQRANIGAAVDRLPVPYGREGARLLEATRHFVVPPRFDKAIQRG